MHSVLIKTLTRIDLHQNYKDGYAGNAGGFGADSMLPDEAVAQHILDKLNKETNIAMKKNRRDEV